MKVAICNVQEFDPTIGGIERVSVSLANGLIAHGIDVVFVSCRKSPFSKSYSLPAPQLFLPEPVDYCPANVEALSRILVEEKVDIVLNQNAHSELYNNTVIEAVKLSNLITDSNLCGKMGGVKLVSVLHFAPDGRIKGNRNRLNFQFCSWKESLVNLFRDLCTRWPLVTLTMHDQRRMFRSLYRHSDRVVLLSDTFKPLYARWSGIKEQSKLTAIHNMLSFPYERKEYPKQKQILFCGRLLFSQKRPDRALYIWQRLQDRLPDWRFVVVGDGPFMPQMLAIVRKLRLERIEFVGFKNPVDYYKDSAILCMTSNHEGWGLVLTEAMQYGCVPIAFDSYESLHDIIADGATGLLVKPFDIAAFADALCRLARSPELPAYSRRCVATMERFLPEKIIQQWIALLEAVADSESPPTAATGGPPIG